MHRTTPIIIALLLPLSASAADMQLFQQGRLLDASGGGVNGTHDLSVRIVDGTDSVRFQEDFTGYLLQDGYFSVHLGAAGSALDTSVFLDHGAMMIEVAVDGDALSRFPAGGYPFVVAQQSLLARETTAQQVLTAVGDVSSDLGSANSDVGSLATAVEGLSNDVNTLSSDVSDVATSLSFVSSDIGSISSDIGNMSTDISGVSSDIGDVSTDISGVSTDISAVSSDISTLSSDLDSVGTTVDSTSQAVAALASAVSGIETSCGEGPTYSQTCSNWSASGWSSLKACREDGRWHRYATTTGSWDMPQGWRDFHAASVEGAETKVRMGREWYHVSVRSTDNPTGGVYLFLTEAGAHHVSFRLYGDGHMDSLHATTGTGNGTWNDRWASSDLGNWHYLTHGYSHRLSTTNINEAQWDGIEVWASY